MKKKDDRVPAEVEVEVGEIYWRVSAVYLRDPTAHAVFSVLPMDIQDKVSRQIVQAVYDCIEKSLRLTPVNIQEVGGIPQKEIEDRVTEFTRFGEVWLRDMQDYVDRIAAEGLRIRSTNAYHKAIQKIDYAPWREVEKAHAEATQDIAAIQVGSANTGDDEVGVLFDHYADIPEEDTRPLKFPWPWMNTMTRGGMYENKIYVFAGPYGQRKSTALYAVIDHAVFAEQKIWTHFAYDGGSKRSQMLKLFVIRWAWHLRALGIPFTCPADVVVNGSIAGRVGNYHYVNTEIAHDLLYNKATPCKYPPGAMDAFSQARSDMSSLQSGKGPGLLIMVDGKKVGMDVYRSVQLLRNQKYGGVGLDGWSVDHIAKPVNRYTDPKQSVPENIRVFTNFTTIDGPPCVIVSHLTVAGIANAQNTKNDDVNAGLRYGQELQQDADNLFLFGYRGDTNPDQVDVVGTKARDTKGGPALRYPIRIDAESGLMWDDPKWAEQIIKQYGKVKRQRQAQIEAVDYEED